MWCWRGSPSSGGTNSYKSRKRSSTLSLSSERRMMGHGDGKKLDTYGLSGSRQRKLGATTSISSLCGEMSMNVLSLLLLLF